MFIIYYLILFLSIILVLVGNYVTTKSYFKVMIKKPFSTFKNYFDFSKLPIKREKDRINFFIPSILFFILTMSVLSMFIYFATFEIFGSFDIYISSALTLFYVICFIIMNWFIYKDVLKIKLYSNIEYKEFIKNFFEENKAIEKDIYFEIYGNSTFLDPTKPILFNFRRYIKKIIKIDQNDIEKRYKVFIKFLTIFANIVPRIENNPEVMITVDNEQISYEKFLDILQINLRYILVN